MNCKDVTVRITAYLDGDLDTATSSALRGHLRECATCRALASDHRAIAKTLAHLPPADPPPAMWQGVMTRLAAEEASDAHRSPRALALRSLFDRLRARMLPIAAAAALATVATVWFVTHDRTPLATSSLSISAPLPLPLPLPVSAPRVDISASLAAESSRIDHEYSTAVSDLLDDVADDRAHWPAARRRAFDTELSRLQSAVDSVSASIAPGTTTGDPFDDADALSAQHDKRDRAWQKLVTFLQHAALGEGDEEARR